MGLFIFDSLQNGIDKNTQEDIKCFDHKGVKGKVCGHSAKIEAQCRINSTDKNIVSVGIQNPLYLLDNHTKEHGDHDNSQKAQVIH